MGENRMPKFQAKVLATKIDERGRMLAKIQCNQKLPPVGTIISIKYGSKRTLSQNAFLWVFYTWLINEGGLKDHGFFCPEALHYSLKAHFLSEKIMSKGEWKSVEEGTTTTLTKSEFADYMDKIDLFISDFFEIDTTPFWKIYERNFKM